MNSMIHDRFYQWKIAVLGMIIVLSVQSQMILAFSKERNKAVLHKQEDNQENTSVYHSVLQKQENNQENTVFIESQPLSKRREKRQSQSKQRPFNLCASKSHCSGNKTVIQKDNSHGPPCYCDNACFETFFDCCPDYESTCGKQKTTNDDRDETTFSSWWKCVEMRTGLSIVECGLSSGVWMVQRCPTTWPSDETKRNCRYPNSQPWPFPIEENLPVVVENPPRFTYRNKYCAICHGVKKYSSWDVRVRVLVTPPHEYDFNAKLRFILDNGGSFDYVKPAETQPRRYCIDREKYRDSCDNLTHNSYKDCMNGPVEIVGRDDSNYFKNKACASCYGKPKINSWDFRMSTGKCGGGGPPGLPAAISVIYNIKNTDTLPTTKIVQNCPLDTVYDEFLEFCREGYVTSAKNVLSNEFLILLWIKPPSPITYRQLKTSLTEKFNLLPSQISDINFHAQNVRDIDHTSPIVATFRLTLTPYQDFILANQENLANMNISYTAKKFLELLTFTGNLSIYFDGNSDPYAVIKLVSKQLACFKGKVLTSSEYQLDKKTGKVFENKTGTYFSLDEGGNITLCRKLVLAQCTNGSYVTLRRGEYVILSNLSLYFNRTNRTYDFGDYQINDDVNDVNETFLNSSERSEERFAENMTFPTHATFAICLPWQRNYNIIVTREGARSDSDALAILTLIGFSISILWLLLFLITYGIFRKLRTVPGMNMMNLCFSLLLFNIFWLIGTPSYSKLTILCTVFAILEHYLILVSFFAMSVISYDSCLVFSQSFAIATTTKDKRRWTIMKYSAIVWCCPAIFVAICVILDKTGVFAINYGAGCWLGTKNAKLYLFLLPVASLLLFNISAFIRTAVSLTRHQTQTQLLQKKKRQNLLICAKLSTMVGFPWLFAFFSAVFPDVVAFEYLFVIFVCLQGFYIGLAFLCNVKTFKFYKNLRNKNEDVTVPLAGTSRSEIQTSKL